MVHDTDPLDGDDRGSLLAVSYDVNGLEGGHGQQVGPVTSVPTVNVLHTVESKQARPDTPHSPEEVQNPDVNGAGADKHTVLNIPQQPKQLQGTSHVLDSSDRDQNAIPQTRVSHGLLIHMMRRQAPSLLSMTSPLRMSLMASPSGGNNYLRVAFDKRVRHPDSSTPIRCNKVRGQYP